MRANEIETCAAKIRAAERVLGRLTEGQRVDLLLDNFSWIPSSVEAREAVRGLVASGEVNYPDKLTPASRVK